MMKTGYFKCEECKTQMKLVYDSDFENSIYCPVCGEPIEEEDRDAVKQEIDEAY